jgi:hypothetical protein
MKLRSLVFAAFLSVPLASFAEVDFSVNIAPPVMPVYEQPLCPVAGYIWTPGYWAYENDYYWVPGVWVPPPRVGLLWTPPWWGWNNGAYVFNQGYWGPRVGFYGGINYGYGYTGNGYWGGRWSGNTFQYNTAVTRVNNTVIHNTYIDRNVVNKQVNRNRAAFNGPNGVKAEPTAEQRAAAANAKKVGPTSEQLSRQQAASKDQNLRASVNKGHPNNEAIKSFNKTEGAGQGKGAQGLEAAGGAAGTGAGAENKPGNLAERQGQGAGAGAGKTGNEPGNVTNRNLKEAGAGAGTGKAENNPANIAEHNRQGAGADNTGAGPAGANGNKLKTENQHNRGNMAGNQAKMHTDKMGGAGDNPGQPHAMNQQMQHHQQQMGGQYHKQQMGGQHQQQKMNAQRHPQMQGGGNRPPPKGQPQGKKKPEKP